MRAKEADRALSIAASLRYVPLRYASRLTLLLAEIHHPRYEAPARRLLERVLVEVEPPLIEAKKLADVLAHVDHYYGTHAQLALSDVVGQLHRRRHRISVDFNSEAP